MAHVTSRLYAAVGVWPLCGLNAQAAATARAAREILAATAACGARHTVLPLLELAFSGTASGVRNVFFMFWPWGMTANEKSK